MKILNSKRAKIWLAASLGVLLSLFAACFIYLGIYYEADEAAISEYPVRVEETELDGNLVFKPQNVNYGLIFYPGGKVDERAYIPLMREISSHGVLCVLVKVPFRLAVFDINAAEGIPESFPEISEWYIGGHSLGGSMAASYLEKNSDSFKGLLLLGAYSTADLSGSELRAISIYGSLDEVMKRDKYEENLDNLPFNFSEIVIEGGNHANFGAYGEQKGDGIASITRKEQITECAEAFVDFLEK